MSLTKVALAIAISVVACVTAQAQSRAENDRRLEGCRSKLKAAAQLNLLKDMSFDGGRPRVVVGPTWHRIDFSAKEGFAQTAACFFLAGDSKKSITFPITDGRTGKKLATWKFTRLEAE